MGAEGIRQTLAGPPKTKEEAHQVCFSPEARQLHKEKYPHLPPDEVERIVDEIASIAEDAKIHHFMPILVDNALRDAGKNNHSK